MPANCQMIQWGPLYSYESIELLNASGRPVFTQRPESSWVRINQQALPGIREASKALLGALAANQQAAAAAPATYLVPFSDFPWNSLVSASNAMDLRSLAQSLTLNIKFKAGSDYIFGTGVPGNAQITDISLLADMFDLPAAALAQLASTYVPRSVLGRSYELQFFTMPALPAGTTGSQPFVANLTALSAPCCNLFFYIIVGAQGTCGNVDGTQTTALPFDQFSITASGTTLVDGMTALESQLEITRLFGGGSSCFGSEATNTDPQVAAFSFALPGSALSTTDAMGAFSFRNSVNPQLTVYSSSNLTVARTLIVISEVLSVLNYSGPYGAQQVTQSSDAL
jgi:hypothetical protein